MNFIAPSPANIGNSPTDSVFTSYLTNDLIASGLYERSLSSKNLEEQEIFKTNLTEIWAMFDLHCVNFRPPSMSKI